jgi:glutathione S-transferase
MKLYYSPGACSLAPHIVFRETGQAVDLERVDGKTKTTASGENFLDINPLGQVPTLKLDDGEYLTEAAALVQYIAERKPDSGLMPAAGTMDRYRVLAWLNFAATELHKNFTPLFKEGTPDDYKPVAKANLEKAFAIVDRHLDGKTYLVGENFTVADAYLFVVTNWSRFQQIDVAQWPNLKAFQERVRARPAVEEAMRAEGMIKTKPAAA